MHNDNIHVHKDSSRSNIPGCIAHSNVSKCAIGDMAFVIADQTVWRLQLRQSLSIFISKNIYWSNTPSSLLWLDWWWLDVRKCGINIRPHTVWLGACTCCKLANNCLYIRVLASNARIWLLFKLGTHQDLIDIQQKIEAILKYCWLGIALL